MGCDSNDMDMYNRPTLEDLQKENGEKIETTQRIYTRGYESGYRAALLDVSSKMRVLLDGLGNNTASIRLEFKEEDATSQEGWDRV